MRRSLHGGRVSSGPDTTPSSALPCFIRSTKLRSWCSLDAGSLCQFRTEMSTTFRLKPPKRTLREFLLGEKEPPAFPANSLRGRIRRGCNPDTAVCHLSLRFLDEPRRIARQVAHRTLPPDSARRLFSGADVLLRSHGEWWPDYSV